MLEMFEMYFSFLGSSFIFILKFFSPFIIMIVYFYIYYFIKGYRHKKRLYKLPKKRGKLKRLLIDFPRQLVLDYYNSDPNRFKNYGIHLIAGEQGSGKTITAVYLMQKLKKEYPMLTIKTNMYYKYEDGQIVHWHDVINSNNGIYGEIDMFDEFQNWFSSMESKNFPVSMLEEITQQRKQSKMIIGTTQVWARVSKPIREQCTYLYEPLTMFGCLTIVRKYSPKVKSDGQLDKKRLRGIFFFIQNEELRNAYDTYRKIERLKEHGFKEENLQNLDNLYVS